ncbi:MAG: glycosyltransferase family 2 protein [Acidothermus sp.]|nr:glycosyltransferase family 2 protein [Acidothermus sp.]
MTTTRIHRSLREAPGTARIVEAALDEFKHRYDGEPFPPLLVVIAALNEEAALPSVLDEIPQQIAGVDSRVLVVDDGSTDRTAEVAAAKGALVCRLTRNCGHGVALRTGYRLAREGGARYVATLDADGQWDPADLPAMVELLEADKADFVVGSRQLGRTENTDRLRNLGVRFFSWLISVLTATRVTDSSSGLRAMRVEVTATVRQTQPQYQTSELLIGAILQGYRIAEVPTVMRVRRAGQSKKGHNLLYGARYARVIIRTYIRERFARTQPPR